MTDVTSTETTVGYKEEKDNVVDGRKITFGDCLLVLCQCFSLYMYNVAIFAVLRVFNVAAGGRGARCILGTIWVSPNAGQEHSRTATPSLS